MRTELDSPHVEMQIDTYYWTIITMDKSTSLKMLGSPFTSTMVMVSMIANKALLSQTFGSMTMVLNLT
jgi:hypothetical protein